MKKKQVIVLHSISIRWLNVFDLEMKHLTVPSFAGMIRFTYLTCWTTKVTKSIKQAFQVSQPEGFCSAKTVPDVFAYGVTPEAFNPWTEYLTAQGRCLVVPLRYRCLNCWTFYKLLFPLLASLWATVWELYIKCLNRVSSLGSSCSTRTDVFSIYYESVILGQPFRCQLIPELRLP